jgi:gliding motility-associated-like protein
VYNRYGENVYSSIGYGIPWNATYKGARLPAGTYYYIIDLKNKSKVLSGFVAIIR